VISFNNLQILTSRLYGELSEAIDSVVASGVYLRGLATALFEQEWAAYCGQKYCVACGSGTDALTLAALTLDLKAAEVPANTIPLTAVGLHRGGAAVRPVDVDHNGRLGTVSPCSVPVLLYGRMPSGQELGCTIFDAAHAHGWKPPAHAVACWSFYPTKTLGAMGDGGAITTNDKNVAKKAKELAGRDDVLRDGRQITSRMDEIQAAILRVKLRHLDFWLRERRTIAETYLRELGNALVSDPTADLNHLIVIRTENRDDLMLHLESCGISSKIHFPQALNTQKAPWGSGESLPNAEKWCRTVLSLPCYLGMTEQDIVYVCEKIKGWRANGMGRNVAGCRANVRVACDQSQ